MSYDYPQSPDSARRGKCDKGTGKVWECSVRSVTKVRGKVKIPTGFDKIASGFIKIASGFVKIPSGLYIFFKYQRHPVTLAFPASECYHQFSFHIALLLAFNCGKIY